MQILQESRDMSNALTAVNTRIRVELARTQRRQSELAGALSLSEAAVSRRMAGLTPWNVLELDTVAKVLGLDLADLVAAEPLAATS